MPKSENFAARADELESLGVPRQVIGYIREQTFPNWRARYTGYITLVMVVLFGTTVASGAALSWLLERLTVQRLQQSYFVASSQRGGLLLFCVGFFWLVAGLLAPLARHVSPRFAEYAAIRSLIGTLDAEGVAAWLTHTLLRKEVAVSRASDPRAFLLQHGSRTTRHALTAGAVLLSLSALSMLVNVTKYDLGTGRGVERHSLLGTELLPWTSLKKVETGCYDHSNSPARGRYELVFDGEARVDAFPEPPDPTNLERLWPLNQMLRERAVPFERARFEGGIYDGEQFWSSGCVDTLADRADVEPRMVDALLVTTEDLKQP
ncbi:hypothetical protein ACMHYB_39135 [Sorangium sp. So ce1128]